MATKKTTPTPLQKKAKSTGAAPAKKVAKSKAEPTYTMPMEVKNWIEQAHSTINHLRGQVANMKTEIAELKAYKKWAEQRILRSDYE